MTAKSYKPIGGVIRATLYAVGDLTSIDEVDDGGGIEVELIDDGSCYEEKFLSDGGLVSVQHTLTLCCQMENTEPWLDTHFVEHAAAEGVVARVELLSGRELIVGWSPRFSFEQALRLKQMILHSGKLPTDTPHVVLTLLSQDTVSAIV